jgi:hypothetical protein
MKKVLLFSLIMLSTICVYAYETVIIKYPPGELWLKVYYKKIGNEALLQYAPSPQKADNWVRTIVVHSYNESAYQLNNFMAGNLARMTKANPTGKYKYLKYTDVDSIAGRCTDDYGDIKAQCEFFRVTRAHGGIITLHYINRDKEDFMKNFHQWYDIIKQAKYYNSYYRDERTFDKSEYFEL